MNSLVALRTQQDDFEVQFEVISPIISSVILNPRQAEIARKLEDVDAQLELCEQKAAELNREIDRLTNHADGLDYSISVISGLITGVIDSFFVGQWDFQNAKAITNQNANNKVIEFVKKDPRYIPWCQNSDDQTASSVKQRLLTSAVKTLSQADAILCLDAAQRHEFSKIFNPRTRPKIENNTQSKEILDVFKFRGWIAGYSLNADNSGYEIQRSTSPRKRTLTPV